jgi:hypothetical protein
MAMDPIWLGGIVGAVVAILVVVWLAKKRS